MDEGKINPIIIPFGEDCLITFSLRNLEKRNSSLPFDWLGYEGKEGIYFSAAVDILCNEFKDFLNLEDLVVIGPTGNEDKGIHVTNTKTGFRYKHDFFDGRSIDEQFPSIKEKYNRRISRLLDLLNNGGNFLFTHMAYSNISDQIIDEKLKKIRDKFPKSKLYFLFLLHDPSKKQYESEIINKDSLTRIIKFNNSGDYSLQTPWWHNERVYMKLLYDNIEDNWVKNISSQKSVEEKGYDIKGINNKIIVVEEDGIEISLKTEKLNGLNIKITGNNNIIIIKKPCKLSNLGIRICSNDAKVIIEKNNTIDNMWCEICGGNNQLISIGENCTILGLTIQACEEKSGFILGDNSLISYNVFAWCSDAHSLISADGIVTNVLSSPIEIAEHCWIGYGVTLYKNAKLEKDSIVAGSSVITKSFHKKNIVVAGNPAKIIKENIRWDISLPYKTNKKNN